MKINANNLLGANKPVFGARNQGVSSVVNEINYKLQNKVRAADAVSISSKLNLLKQESEKTEDDKTIDYENSPIVGKRTQAEWAELSMRNKRNSLDSMANSLEYQKEKLTNAMDKIAEYEKTAAGDFSAEDLEWMAFCQKNVSENIDWAQVRMDDAAKLAERYRNSIIKDFTQEVKDHLDVYEGFTKAYDKYSGGKASQILGEMDISAESLGLTNLSDDPREIMDALNNAVQKLKDASKKVETAYEKATGGKAMTPSGIVPNKEMWKHRIEMENVTLEAKDFNDIIMGDKTLKLDKFI